MTSKRSSIRLSPDEDQLLRTLHRQSGIPDGQFPQRPRFWHRFTEIWNEATERDDSPEEILHYIMTRRKRPHGRPGRWEPFGPDHKRLRNPEPDLLAPEQWEIVNEIYVEMNLGADNYLVDAAARTDLLKRLAARTGEHVSDLVFVAALIARRKGGLLPKTGTGADRTDIGFQDLDEVG